MRIIVTGGNSGVGKETATTLAAAGHSVLIAARDIPKAERAAADMTGEVEVAHLDLADLTSVRKFADSVDNVDVLVNNAGVLGLPLSRTADGFETHMGTNYLGHFALTCLLGDRITDRVVSVTSMNHMFSRMHLEDLNWHTRPYSKWAAYGQSKLAVMLFTDELARRGVRADRRRSRRCRHQHRPVQRGFPSLVLQAGDLQGFPAEREGRVTVQRDGCDARPPGRDISVPGVQAVRQAAGDQADEEGSRRQDRAAIVDAVGRTHRMRLATLVS